MFRGKYLRYGLILLMLFFVTQCAHHQKKNPPENDYSVEKKTAKIPVTNNDEKNIDASQSNLDEDKITLNAKNTSNATNNDEQNIDASQSNLDEDKITLNAKNTSKNQQKKNTENQNNDNKISELQKRLMNIPQPPPQYHPYLEADKIAKKPDSNQLISLNFNNEPIGSVLKALFADTLKLNYILDKEVSGNITVVTTTPFPKKDLFDIILLILKLNGLTITRSGDYYIIVPTGDIKKYLLPTHTGTDAEKIKPSERIITQVVPLNYLAPSDVAGIINELKSPETELITLDAANILIFTGPASNIRRLMEMIHVLDVETSQDEFKVFQIKYADANDILTTLQNLFAKKVSGKGVPIKRNTRRSSRRLRKTREKKTASGGIISVGGSSSEPVIIVDQRSNSLMVFGTKKDMEFIQKIINILDVDIYTYQEIFIYYVENAKAKDLKAILEQLYKGQSSSSSRKPPHNTRRRTKLIEKERPGQIVGDVRMAVDERTNALIIQTTQRNYKILESMIKKLDVVPKQVLIEVLIAEITLDDSQELGFQWNLKSSGTLGNNSFSSTTNTNFGKEQGTGLNWTIFEASRFQSFLRTFATNNRLEVLSNPHIMCSNNQEAKIDIGDEIPTITSSTTNTNSSTNTGSNVTNTVEYRNTGILLTVNARVNERRMVSMDISQEVSEAQENQLANINSPIIRKRVLKTSVVIRDNQTLVMGGLMQKKKDLSHQGIPLLSKIPFLRWLFGTESRTGRKTELIVFISPHVIGNPEENFEKTNELLNKLPKVKKEIKNFRH